MKRITRSRVVSAQLLRLLTLYPSAKIICVSSGLLSRRITDKRSLKSVGYSRELNTLVIEYYE